jgi:hypothetical protein
MVFDPAILGHNFANLSADTRGNDASHEKYKYFLEKTHDLDDNEFSEH